MLNNTLRLFLPKLAPKERLMVEHIIQTHSYQTCCMLFVRTHLIFRILHLVPQFYYGSKRNEEKPTLETLELAKKKMSSPDYQLIKDDYLSSYSTVLGIAYYIFGGKNLDLDLYEQLVSTQANSLPDGITHRHSFRYFEHNHSYHPNVRKNIPRIPETAKKVGELVLPDVLKSPPKFNKDDEYYGHCAEEFIFIQETLSKGSKSYNQIKKEAKEKGMDLDIIKRDIQLAYEGTFKRFGFWIEITPDYKLILKP